ncbi:hypothetical protein E0H46_31700 [Rhizobium leguminosarum bv. viciae]|nr:hypothetical protein E0H46_31700 [Rhizobium leguminosarum bv. viciae]
MATTLTPIESAKYNAFVNDLTTDANAARPISAGGTAGTSIATAQTALSVDNKVVYAAKAGNYTALGTDNNAVHRYTATATVTLTAAATLGVNWHYTIIADGADVTIDPNGAETIDGAATLVIPNGYSALIICNGSAFFTNKMATTVKALATSLSAFAPPGHLYGLTLSNNVSDATNDIDIAIGSAASDATSPAMMTLASALTKRLDAGWAVGTNQGGLDTGSIANTTYHIWLIARSDTGVVDALFSTSATSPTMPTNYDRKRRIGAIKRESAAIVAFIQDGDFFQWMVPTADVTTISTTPTLRNLRLPAGLQLVARCGISITHSNAMATVNHWDPAIGSTLPINQLGGFQVFVNTVTNQGGTTVQEVRTNSSGQVYASSSSSALTTYTLATLGYFDRRGRF